MHSVALPAPPLYLPLDDPPWRMAMALQARPEADWIEIDSNYPAHLAERCRLLTLHPADVLAAEPDTAATCQELLEMLATHLCQHHPAWFSRQGARLRNHLRDETWPLDTAEPLRVAGHLVQEDFCILRPEADGPRLVAAVLCFPSRWRLADKIGRLLAPIHAPVPFYGERLARPVDRFLASLRPGRLAMRLNWSILDDPALFQPTGHGSNDAPAPLPSQDLGETLFLRVERQTFRRLPQSGAVVFGIRVHVTKLGAAVAHPPDAARLAAAIAALPPDMARYKSMLPFRAALLDWLSQRSA
jgi:hypothetical protein